MGGGEGHRVWATTVLCRNWRPVRQAGRGGSSAIRINHGDLTALLYLQGYGRGEFVAERRVMEVLAEVVGYGSWQTTVPWPEPVSRCMPSRWSSLNPYPYQLLRPDRAALPVMRRPRRVRDRPDEVKEGGWRRELLIWATVVLFRNRCRPARQAGRDSILHPYHHSDLTALHHSHDYGGDEFVRGLRGNGGFLAAGILA